MSRIRIAPAKELALALQCDGIGGWVTEFRFHPPRRFRWDFAWPERMLAVEVDGGTWSGGRHTRGAGFEADCRKINLGILAGWRVLRFTTDMVQSGEALTMIKGALCLTTSYSHVPPKPAFAVRARYKRIGKLAPRRFPLDEEEGK